MWQHVLAQIDCKLCKLCGESVSEVSEIQLEHCFLLCPAISDLREAELTRLTVEDVKYPEPHEFRRVLAFVASVLERHRWQADLEKAESSDQERDEREKNEKNEKYETKQKEKNTIEEEQDCRRSTKAHATSSATSDLHSFYSFHCFRSFHCPTKRTGQQNSSSGLVPQGPREVRRFASGSIQRKDPAGGGCEPCHDHRGPHRVWQEHP